MKPCRFCRADEGEPCRLSGHKRDSAELTVALEMSCPECFSAPGSWCRSPSDRRRTKPHSVRVIAYFDVAHLL